MVDVKIFPGVDGKPNHGVWRGRKGRKFAMQIGKQRRQHLLRFVVNQLSELPVTVSMLLLDQRRQSAAYPVSLGVRKFVAFIVGQFFILIQYDHLTSSVQSTIGETTFSQEELVDLVLQSWKNIFMMWFLSVNFVHTSTFAVVPLQYRQNRHNPQFTENNDWSTRGGEHYIFRFCWHG